MLQVSFTYAVGCVTNADEFQMEKLICKVNIMKLVLLKKIEIIYFLKKIRLYINTMEYCYQQCVKTCIVNKNMQG